MKILGIDPGLRTTGFGVIEKHGNKLTYIASGTIKTPDADLPQRLKTILVSVAEVICDLSSRLRRDRKSLRQRQSAIDAVARPGARRGDLRIGGR